MQKQTFPPKGIGRKCLSTIYIMGGSMVYERRGYNKYYLILKRNTFARARTHTHTHTHTHTKKGGVQPQGTLPLIHLCSIQSLFYRVYFLLQGVYVLLVDLQYHFLSTNGTGCYCHLVLSKPVIGCHSPFPLE